MPRVGSREGWGRGRAGKGPVTASIIIQPDDARGCTNPKKSQRNHPKNVACSSFMIDGSAHFEEKKVR